MPVRVGYLCSRYPAISHTFVLREVLGLRAAGAEVETFSVRRSDDDDLLSAADRAEHAATTALLPAGPLRVLRAHVRGALTRPTAYLATLRHALALRPPGWRGALWQLFYFAEAVLLWSDCRRRGVGHVHVHFANPAADVAMLAARFGGTSWSFTMHGPAELADVRGHRLREKVESAAFAACTSDFVRSQLLSAAGYGARARLPVVRTGIDVDGFAVRAAGERDPGPLRLLNIGRLAPVKGQGVLIEAVALLAQRGVDAHATIVGPGTEEDALRVLAREAGVEDRIELTGPVGQDDIQALYERADVFCSPSFAEGLPLVLIEAMAKGVPVIATTIMGIPELVEHERTGLLLAPGRPDLLADAVERLVAEPELAARLAVAGREKVVADFDRRRTSDELLALFAGVADG